MLRYAITDRRWLGGTEAEHADALVEHAARLAARANIDYFQLRENDLRPATLAALARRIMGALHANAPDSAGRPKLLINSRADVAIAVGADGVHRTSHSGELAPAQVRSLYAAAGLLPPIVSLSCHTLSDVIAARDLSSGSQSAADLCFAPDIATTPDIILFGPVFEKCVGGRLISEGSGLDLLRQACAAAAPLPVLALGGITDENTAECLEVGASGVAAIRLFGQ